MVKDIMKKLLIILSLLFVSIFAMDTIIIPINVKEVKSVTFSSGGGDKAVVYVKVFCIMNDGKMILFNASKVSASGMFGLGRWTISEAIEIKKSAY